MAEPTRRSFLAGAAAVPLTAATTEHADPHGSVAEDLARYISFGNKQSGSAGDNGCGDWLADELVRAGFAVEKRAISVPCFTPGRCVISIADTEAALWPQPIVVQTPGKGVSGRLVRVDGAGRANAPLDQAIALVDLPYGRWSSALTPSIRRPIDAAFSGGARAAVVVTNGPTGKVIALNAHGGGPMFAGPVGLIAPADAAPFLAGAMRHERATVTLTGQGGRRSAFNVVGRLDRGKGRWVVVSTPRSGWFCCAGERGGGIAAWLDLARWAPGALPDYDFAFISNSGHEYENLGAEVSLRAVAPRPPLTHFWLHLGANLAARDWHDGLFGLSPLPGTDSQRYLVVSPTLLAAARGFFAGLAGLEAPYLSTALSAGELTPIIAAGYRSVAGVFGVHRFHHVADDDARCVPPAPVARTITAFRRLLIEAARA